MTSSVFAINKWFLLVILIFKLYFSVQEKLLGMFLLDMACIARKIVLVKVLEKHLQEKKNSFLFFDGKLTALRK
jgi:hypothetical protein